MDKKETVGSLIYDNEVKNLSLDDDIREYRNAMEPEIIKRLHATAQEAKKSPQYYNKNFYIVLKHKNNPVLKHPEFFYLARMSCPTPVYGDSVWKYHSDSDSLEYLWTIPPTMTARHIYKYAPKFLANKNTSDIAKMVCLMESGELLEWVKKENGEKPDAIIRINKEEQS
jgi:hypothetical protein